MAVISSVTGLNVAQPSLAVEFTASQSTVLWMINLYTITLAALLLPLGALGDRWGRRPMLLAGLAVFGLASVMAGVAPSSGVMLVARLMSGVGAAMIMPITLAVITSTFPEEERSRAVGVWTGVAGGGGIIGMYLSAVLVDIATWRWLFALPAILTVVACAMTLRFIPDSRERIVHPFDTVGSLLSIISTVGVVYALHEAPSHGWGAPMTVLSLGLGSIGIIGFIKWELRHPGPLLDVRHFRERSLTMGSVAILIFFGVQAGVFIVLFPFFQAVVGWSGLRSTFALMPMALLMMLASGLAPQLVKRIGSRLTMATGVVLGGAGLALMSTLVSVDGGYLSVLPGMLAMGLGMGLTMTPSTEAITSALPREQQGVASALNDITRELGSALGVALLGALVTAGYSDAITHHLSGFSPRIAAAAREGIANAMAAAHEAGPQSDMLIHAAKESFVDGWQRAMMVGAGVMAVLFVFIIVPGPRAESSGSYVNEDAQPETWG